MSRAHLLPSPSRSHRHGCLTLSTSGHTRLALVLLLLVLGLVMDRLVGLAVAVGDVIYVVRLVSDLPLLLEELLLCSFLVSLGLTIVELVIGNAV